MLNRELLVLLNRRINISRYHTLKEIMSKTIYIGLSLQDRGLFVLLNKRINIPNYAVHNEIVLEVIGTDLSMLVDFILGELL
jgi:hypothetical protein